MNSDSFESKLHDTGIWIDAPLLVGGTKFDASPDIKNIMITGGEGFMCVPMLDFLSLGALSCDLLGMGP